MTGAGREQRRRTRRRGYDWRDRTWHLALAMQLLASQASRELLMLDLLDQRLHVTTVPESAPFAIYRGQLYTSSPEDMPPLVRMHR